MLRQPTAAHRWSRPILLAAIVLLPTAGLAQVVHNPDQPSRPGERARWVLELPPDWSVDTVTFDPLGFGLDTFMQRAYRQTLGCPGPTECWSATVFLDDRLQPGDRSVTFTAVGRGLTHTVTGRLRVAAPADDDRDGMPDVWERREGLEPFDRLGTSAPGDDPDGDGVANIDEFRAGTAPMGRYRLLFGDSSMGERQRMGPIIRAIQPDSLGGPVRVRFIGDGGRQMLPPVYAEGPEVIGSSIPQEQVVADRVLAVEVESFQPIAAERDLNSYDYFHLNSTRPVAPSTDWHFATGPSSSPVDVFLMAYNPGSTPVTARFTYYRSSAEAPAVNERVLAPGRTTIWLNADESALSGRDFAVAISADAPIVVDRGFRWRAPGRTAPQEQTGPGVTAPAAQWHFPRVGTSPGGNDLLVLANPGERESTIELAVFGRQGEPRVSYVTVGAHARLPVAAGSLGGDLFSGVRLMTVNGTPFVAELLRESSTPAGDVVSSSPGTTEVGTVWAMGLPSGGHLAILNPSDEDAQVEVTAWYTPTYGTAATRRTVRAAARRLTLVSLWDDPFKEEGAEQLTGQTASVRSLPRTDGRPAPGIVVGRVGWTGALGFSKARFEPFIAVRVR